MKRIVFLALILACSLPLIAQLHYTNKDLPCVNKTFNLQVHIVLDSFGTSSVSEADIRAAIAGASEKFAPICMSFQLCDIHTIVNYNFDSIPNLREYGELATKYAYARRLNIFICSELFVKLGEMPIPIGGLAANSIFLASNSLGALTHELGHVFGLDHTFAGSGAENVDGSNCTTEGDFICDTPADPYIWPEPMDRYIDGNCEFIGKMKDRNGQYYSPHVANVMSYYGCPCSEFTRGQFLVMVNNYNTSFKNYW